MKGIIVKGIAGFYYVHDGRKTYECKARGIFRKNREKPLVGDRVLFDVISEEESTGNIQEILKRENRLIRPEIANVDRVFLLFSATVPEPNWTMLNRYLVMLQDLDIPVSLVVNKNDLADDSVRDRIRRNFVNTGYEMHFISVRTGDGVQKLQEEMEGHVTALAGPSGVGKSSLLNCLLQEQVMETGDLSRKIERGKNTTRHSEILCVSGDTYVFDTPGFTSVELDYMDKEHVERCFEEFEPYIGCCRFNSCRHLREPDCAVKKAVSEGFISACRYESYREIFTRLSELRRY